MPTLSSPASRYDHVNITGNVPTISQAIKFALELGYNPRVVKAAIGGAANVIITAHGQSSGDNARDHLVLQSWAFTHHKPEFSHGQHGFYILATF